MKNIYKINDNIYITNDEEIKDCWVLNTHTNEFYFLKYYYGTQPITKKIVLTTDQDLIADGVEAIDDDFLEWFIKNQSCEEVKVVYSLDTTDGISVFMYSYKIILPTDNPETLPDDLFYNLEPVQDTFTFKELVIYNYVGCYRLGGEKGLSIFFENKPKWLHRKMMKLCLGLEWIDN
jgi:hypothetical protein